MQPKFGSLTNPTKDIVKEIQRVRRQGFDFVEIGIEPPNGLPEILFKKRGKIKRLLKQFKYPPIGHTSWWVEFGSHHELVRVGWVREGKRMIDVAKVLGVEMINFHGMSFGMVMGKARKKSLDNFAKSMRELVRYGKRKGVKVMLENVPDNKLGEFQNFKYLTDHVKGLGVHLDVAHAFISGGMKDVVKYIRTFKDRIWHIHIHDNHGKEDEHLGLGKGKMNFARIVKELKNIKYNKTITFEVFTSNKDMLRSRERLKRLWNM